MSNIIRAKNQNGDWIEIPALAGHDGIDGITPHIGENGNWFIGEVDTGNKAGLEVATREILGGVRVGEGLNIDENGVLTGAPSSIVNYIEEHQYFVDGTTPPFSDGWYVFRGGVSFNGVDAGEDGGWINANTLIYIRSATTRIYLTIIAPYRAHTNNNIAVYRYYDLDEGKWYPETATSAYTITGLTTSTGLSKTNTTSYTPTSNYHPATKKYVDDAILSLSAPACMVYTDDDATILAVLQDCVTVDIDEYAFLIKKPALFQSMYGMAYLNTITATGKVVSYTFTGFVDDTVGQQDSKIQKVEVILAHNTETNELTKNTYLIETNCLHKNNTTAFTPTEDYNPATKKYVDDAIVSAITNTLGGVY